jgi:replicative DNA helicase
MITGQVIVSLLEQGQKAVIASMEMPIHVTLDRMMTQVLKTHSPTKSAAREFFQWVDDKLFMYQQEGAVPARRILGLARYAAVEMGIENIVIDSLMMVGVDAKGSFEKMESQGQFVRDLAMIARDTGCHIHLVCHLRKSESGAGGRSEADDVKGAGEITDLASVVYILSVNRKKREESKKPVPNPKTMEQADVFLSIEKNRNGPTGAVFGLRSLPNMQFVTNAQNKPMDLVRQFKF